MPFIIHHLPKKEGELPFVSKSITMEQFPNNLLSLFPKSTRLACDNLPEESVGPSGRVLTGGGEWPTVETVVNFRDAATISPSCL